MQVDVLGPLEVRVGNHVVPVSGARLRRLLLRLAIAPGQVVPVGQVIDAVWPDDPPADAPNALQSLVSRLRRALGDPGAVQQAAGGYRLAIGAGDSDATRFTALAAEGRELLDREEFDAAASTLRVAIGLWRGPALLDADDAPYARGPAVRLEEQRLAAVADRLEADLRGGHAADVIAELEELAADHPMRDRFTGLLMRALAATGRTPEALAAYERARTRLADELGIDPSAELQAQHLAVLRGELDDPPASQTGTAVRRQSNLRATLTTFLGRDDEVKRITDLLDSGRLTTIVGPGGAGKTRLASHVGTGLIDRLRDGVWFVELAPVTEEANIGQAFLGALGLREGTVIERRPDRDTRDAIGRLQDALADAECLIVVDNCEHLISSVAQVIDLLLAGAPRLRILATSREPLGIAGESLCVLGPLPLPEPGVSAEVALTYPSVQLFDDRGRSVRADYETSAATVDDVVEIVRRLDGLPLAIELAAARLRVLPVSEIAARLGDRFRLLTGGSRTAMARHRTLRAVVEWSWDLLTAAERSLAERLSVFPAGVTVESATAVCRDADLGGDGVPELLDALVDKSLLQLVDSPGLRYRMLETIREYGADRLVEQGEIVAVRAAHAEFFAALVREADNYLRTADQLTWLARLTAELDNILAALRFLGDQGETEAALELALLLSWYWTMTGNRDEQSTWLAFALGLRGSEDSPRRTLAEAAYTVSAFDLRVADGERDWEQTKLDLQALAARLDDLHLDESPIVLITQPILLYLSGDHEASMAVVERARSSHDPWVRASILSLRAALAENEGDLDAMRAAVTEAHDGFTRIGDRWGLASTLSTRARVRTMDGDLTGAMEDVLASLEHQRAIGSTEDEAFTRMRLADLRMRLGDFAGAEEEINTIRISGLGAGPMVDWAIFAQSAKAAVVSLSGDLPRALQIRADVLRHLGDLPPAFGIEGHAKAMAMATAAGVSLLAGDLAAAADDLAVAYPTSVGTQDLPIMAMVGVVVASYAHARGAPYEGAVILGAAARLRGSPDHTDVAVARTTVALRAELGADFERAFTDGQALSREAAIARLDPRPLGEAGP